MENSSIENVNYKHLFHALAQISFDGVMVTEAQQSAANGSKHPIIFVNETFSKLTGYSPEDVLGKDPKLLQGPDTDCNVIANVEASLSADCFCDAVTTNYTKQGVPFTMRWSIAPVRNDEGNVSHHVAVHRA